MQKEAFPLFFDILPIFSAKWPKFGGSNTKTPLRESSLVSNYSIQRYIAVSTIKETPGNVWEAE